VLLPRGIIIPRPERWRQAGGGKDRAELWRTPLAGCREPLLVSWRQSPAPVRRFVDLTGPAIAGDRQKGSTLLVDCLGAKANQSMPLRDHFRPPLDDLRHWEGFHATWPVMIVALLRRKLPRRYFAEPRVHSGSSAEIDVATFEGEGEDALAAG